MWGLDIGNYNNTETSLSYADEYILTTGEEFAKTIASLGSDFDAVISSHNLEHCNYPMETLNAMCSCLKPGGKLYLAFPSEASVLFPCRTGALNFYQDDTHIYLPVLRDIMKKLIRDNKMNVDFVDGSYKPFPMHQIAKFINWFIGDGHHIFFAWHHFLVLYLSNSQDKER